jgi:hypothetical protein
MLFINGLLINLFLLRLQRLLVGVCGSKGIGVFLKIEVSLKIRYHRSFQLCIRYWACE